MSSKSKILYEEIILHNLYTNSAVEKLDVIVLDAKNYVNFNKHLFLLPDKYQDSTFYLKENKITIKIPKIKNNKKQTIISIRNWIFEMTKNNIKNSIRYVALKRFIQRNRLKNYDLVQLEVRKHD